MIYELMMLLAFLTGCFCLYKFTRWTDAWVIWLVAAGVSWGVGLTTFAFWMLEGINALI